MLHDSSKGTPPETVVGEDAIRSHLSKLNREVSKRKQCSNVRRAMSQFQVLMITRCWSRPCHVQSGTTMQ